MHTDPIQLIIERKEGPEEKVIPIGSVSCARFSSRDLEATRKELDDMIAEEGRYTAACLTNPSICRIARYLLTQDAEFDVQGSLTGGEGEFVVIRNGAEVFISVGSDQCDREIDGIFPDKPKQMCPHPMARTAWPYEEVRDHWDSLRIHSEITCRGRTVTLQDASISELVDCEYLLAMESVQALPDPMFLFGGATEFVPTLEDEVLRLGLPEMTCHGVGDSFMVQLIDPVLDRTISHKFSAIPLGDDYNERKDRGEQRAPHH
jgi:hypothetical protein